MSGYLMITSWEALTEWPIENKVSLSSVLNAVFDTNGNMYAIDNSKTRIVVADNKGIVSLKLKASDNQNKTVCRFSDFVVDKDSNLYVLKTVMNLSGTVILREDIIKYPAADRTKSKVLARANYGAPKEKYGPENPKTKKLLGSGEDGSVYYYSAQKSEVVRKKIPSVIGSSKPYDIVKNEKSDIIIPIHVHHTYLANISSYGKNSLAYTTKSGEIYHINENGQAVKDNSNADNTQNRDTLPVSIGTDARNRIYYADLTKGEIRRIDYATGLNQLIRLRQLLQR